MAPGQQNRLDTRRSHGDNHEPGPIVGAPHPLLERRHVIACVHARALRRADLDCVRLLLAAGARAAASAAVGARNSPVTGSLAITMPAAAVGWLGALVSIDALGPAWVTQAAAAQSVATAPSEPATAIRREVDFMGVL